MQDFFSLETCAIARESAELTLPSRKSTLSLSISLRAFSTAVPASPLVEIFDHQFGAAAENSAFDIDLFKGELAANQLVPAQRGERAGQRVVETDPDDVSGERAQHERTRHLRAADRKARFQQAATMDAA